MLWWYYSWYNVSPEPLPPHPRARLHMRAIQANQFARESGDGRLIDPVITYPGKKG